jgi:ABC-type nitrate/sulfonate/bicarbonate transport system substrate-binding protein
LTRQRTTWVIAGFFLLAGVLAGLRLAARRDGRVRVAYLPVMASLPVFVAQDQRFFANHGLRAQTVLFSSSNDMVTALVSGQIDVVPAVALVPLIHLEIQHPGKVRVISHSRMRRENSTYRIVVKGASALSSLRDLEGRKVGVFPGTSATRLVSAFLKRKSVDPEKITFVQLPPSSQVASLESGAVDALFAYEPIALISAPGRYRTLSNSVYAELSEPCPLGVSVISRDFERHHRRVGAATAAAVQEAIAYMGAHPQEAKSLLPRFTKMTPEMASRVNVADMTLSNTIDAEVLQGFIELLYEIGEIPERIDAHRLIDPTR